MAARSRQSVHRGALIRMLELIDAKRILIVDPTLGAKMIPCTGKGRAIDLLSILHHVGIGDAIVDAEQTQKAGDLDCREDIALGPSRIGGWHRAKSVRRGGTTLRRRSARSDANEQCDAYRVANEVAHALLWPHRDFRYRLAILMKGGRARAGIARTREDCPDDSPPSDSD